MPDSEYLFIDGAYLRRIHEKALFEYFRETGEIDFETIKRSASATRVFYYDCLDHVRGTDEEETEFENRVERQQQVFNRIRSLPGFHVQLGSLSGDGERKRQKQVDVRLAVDMMYHALHKNMTRASLIAGDLDFKPIVDNLILLGTYTRVFYEPRSAAKDLYWAADVGQEINFRTLYDWTKPEFTRSHSIPTGQWIISQSIPDSGWTTIKSGQLDGRTAILSRVENQFVITLVKFEGEKSLRYEFKNDAQELERYVTYVHGAIEWSQ